MYDIIYIIEKCRYKGIEKTRFLCRSKLPLCNIKETLHSSVNMYFTRLCATLSLEI